MFRSRITVSSLLPLLCLALAGSGCGGAEDPPAAAPAARSSRLGGDSPEASRTTRAPRRAPEAHPMRASTGSEPTEETTLPAARAAVPLEVVSAVDDGEAPEFEVVGAMLRAEGLPPKQSFVFLRGEHIVGRMRSNGAGAGKMRVGQMLPPGAYRLTDRSEQPVLTLRAPGDVAAWETQAREAVGLRQARLQTLRIELQQLMTRVAAEPGLDEPRWRRALTTWRHALIGVQSAMRADENGHLGLVDPGRFSDLVTAAMLMKHAASMHSRSVYAREGWPQHALDQPQYGEPKRPLEEVLAKVDRLLAGEGRTSGEAAADAR